VEARLSIISLGVSDLERARSKGEVDEIPESARNAEGTLLKPAHDTLWGGYSGYFSDPDGHIWEVAYADSWQFNAAGNLVLD
jgi:predicted lactoylglutathione lyase